MKYLMVNFLYRISRFLDFSMVHWQQIILLYMHFAFTGQAYFLIKVLCSRNWNVGTYSFWSVRLSSCLQKVYP